MENNIEIQSTYEMFIAQTRVCGNPWDFKIHIYIYIYYIHYTNARSGLGRMSDERDRKNLPRVLTPTSKPQRVFRVWKNSCVRKIVQLFYLLRPAVYIAVTDDKVSPPIKLNQKDYIDLGKIKVS